MKWSDYKAEEWRQKSFLPLARELKEMIYNCPERDFEIVGMKNEVGLMGMALVRKGTCCLTSDVITNKDQELMMDFLKEMKVRVIK